MKKLMGSLLSSVLLCEAASGGSFQIESAADGSFRVLEQTGVLVERIHSQVPGSDDSKARQSSTAALPDGTKVWNLWSEEPDRSFRTEIALAPDGESVEITFAAYCRSYAPGVTELRMLELLVPLARFAGGSYEGLTGRATQCRSVSGKLDDAPDHVSLGNQDWRFLVLSDSAGGKISFDFNPIGAGDFISIYKDGTVRGVWGVRRENDLLRFIGGTAFYERGGFIGAKVRIRRGGMENFDHDHALRSFFYTQSMKPERLLSFGAVLKGTSYTAARLFRYGDKGPWGWLESEALELAPSRKPGAYYSNAVGKNASYRVGELSPGLYLVTVGAGNWQNRANRFSVFCNDTPLFQDLTVGDREAVIATLPVWIENGAAELKFEGDFLLSTIAVQRLIASAEDFSFRRGYWVSDGFEPAPVFRNQDYRDPLLLQCFVERFPMPEPGRETAAPRRQAELERATLPAEHPGAMWRYTVNIGNGLSNSSTLAELDDPRSMAEFLRRMQAEKRNAVIVSGLHSRHTYTAHLERGQRAMKMIADAAHKHNIRVIDHHDVTLLWNLDRGFRTLAERLPEVTRSLRTNLPGYQFCIMNPAFRKTYMDYILREVEDGVDGFMCDEIQFFEDCCGCRYCREAFRRDTGWELPLNEMDRFFADMTPLKQAYHRWRKEKVGDFWVELRKRINTVNPDVTLLVYTTHYGFIERWASLTQGLDLFEEARGADFFGTEIMTRNALRSARTLPGFRKAKNLLRKAFGTPIWGLVTTQPDYDAQYFGWAICKMNGQSPWLNDVIQPKGEQAFLRFAPALDMDTACAVPEAAVALLFSADARDFSPNGGLHDMFGTAQTLDSMHVSYEIIGPMSLKGEVLKKYAVLIVAGIGCLDNAEVRAIRDFAQNGGTVLLTDNSGAFDRNGRPAEPWRFADIFTDPAVPKIVFKPVLVDLNGKTLRAPGGIRQLQQPENARKLLDEKAFGKGKFYRLRYSLGSALYAAEGTPGRVWDFTLDGQLDALYRQVLEIVTAPGRVWEVQAPPLVLTTLYRDGEKLVAHFLNATACHNTPGKPMELATPSPAFPELAEEITFTVFGDWERACAVSPDFEGIQELPVRRADGKLTVTLPKKLFHAYSMIHIYPKTK